MWWGVRLIWGDMPLEYDGMVTITTPDVTLPKQDAINAKLFSGGGRFENQDNCRPRGGDRYGHGRRGRGARVRGTRKIQGR